MLKPSAFLLLALASLLSLASFNGNNLCVDAALSRPLLSDTTGLRAQEIAALATQIKNEPRVIKVGNKTLPFYTGPVALPGSLTLNIRLEEATNAIKYASDIPKYMAMLVVPRAPYVKTMEEIAALYDLGTARVEKPMAVDNSDENYGQQRLTVLAMKLRQVAHKDPWGNFQLTNLQLQQICGNGMTWPSIRHRKSLYIEDFSDASKWNEPEKLDLKYVPNVVGFFCYNHELQKLLPVEIRLLETGLAYTPLDTKDEWTLAKMALSAASTSFHQMFHMADTHALTIPVRVELFRTMAAAHPVRALIQHHVFVDFGLEMLFGIVLVSPETPLDRTFGWGAVGSGRFLDYHLKNFATMNNDFPTDILDRGLDDIPTHKYALHGRKLHDALTAFVSGYVDVYYSSDAAVASDFELQNWAQACALVPHLKDFPTALTTKASVVKLVAHLVFQSAVKHHAINGKVTWHSLAVPYSSTALWKKLPTQKLSEGESINLREYTVPASRLHEAIGVAGMFHRVVPGSEGLPTAYQKAPFSNEPLLQPVIAQFEASMASIDAFIHTSEASEKFPYEILRPSELPFYTWV